MPSRRGTGLGFVDDALDMVEGKTFEDNVNMLIKLMTRKGEDSQPNICLG
jgi:hypothetical protein